MGSFHDLAGAILPVSAAEVELSLCCLREDATHLPAFCRAATGVLSLVVILHVDAALILSLLNQPDIQYRYGSRSTIVISMSMCSIK
jgi:hypothetical protein